MSLILSMLVRGSVLMLAAAAIDGVAGRRASAATRHLLWTCTIVGLLMLPVLSVALPRWAPVSVRIAALENGERLSSAEPAPTAAAPMVVAKPAAASPRASFGTSNPGGRLPLAAGAPLSFAIVYLGVACLLLVRIAVQRLTIERLARRAAAVEDPEWLALLTECLEQVRAPRSVRLLRSVEATMPMAFGVCESGILLPSVADTWSADRRRAVLVHELGHIARRDCLIQMLAAVACAAYWLHPGSWWIARRLRAEREMACDDRVLAAGTSAPQYATHLLELAYSVSGDRAPAVAVAMAAPGHVESRLLAILDAARNRKAPTLGVRITCAMILAAVLVPIASATARQMPRRSLDVAPMASSRSGQDTDDRVAEPAQPLASLPLQIPGQAGQARSRGQLDDAAPGTWRIRLSDQPGMVRLTLTEGDDSTTSELDIERLTDLTPGGLTSGFGPVYFSLRREAGTFALEGFVRDGVGAGTYRFVRNPSFAAELARRGVTALSPGAQRLMAREDLGLEFLDELNAQGYPQPSAADLIRMAQHGVGPAYLREMGSLGYRLHSIDDLITLRDHGVTPEFVRDLADAGFKGLAAGDLVRARDHGVDPVYVSQLAQLGIKSASLDALINARDHGIDPEYVRALRDLGYTLPLEDLKRTRDHGVDPEYIRGLAELGYQQLPIEALIDIRDHGIDPEFVGGMRALGYTLPLDALKRARDHGVDPDYVRDMSSLGYSRLSLDALVRLRDSGVDPAFVRDLRALGYEAVGLDELVRLRNLGVTH